MKRPDVITIDGDALSQAKYDLAIFALGFESRAKTLAKNLVSQIRRSIAIGFDHGHELAYSENVQFFRDAGVEVLESVSDGEFESTLRDLVHNLKDEGPQHLLVDVSCFSRFRLASLIHEFFTTAQNRKSSLSVDFAYSLAQFEKPAPARRVNTVVGPTHHAFAGWSQGGHASTATVLGLGYEHDQAMGIVEHLQAGEVWAFTPTSPIAEYKPEVQRANQLLLTEIPPSHVIDYDVCAPASVIAVLESVVRGLSNEHSVVLVPFGPKIFVLCSLVVAAMRQDVAVWRVSQGSYIEPYDREPSGIKVGLRLMFGGATVR